jgi:hypothetical protein
MELCAAWECPIETDTVVLALSELVSRAVRLSSDDIEVSLEYRNGWILARVSDNDPTVVPGVGAEGDGDAWGMRIVEALTYYWNVDYEPEGKTVRFEVPSDPSRVVP